TQDSPEIVLANATGDAIKVLVQGVQSGNLVLIAEAALSFDGGAQTVALQRFDAWGNKTQSAGASIPQYGYTGREPDATGLIYYRARYYDPTIGRFISRDPAGMPDGVNRYAYVGNDPVNYTDPSGEIAVNAAGAGWGALAGGVSGAVSGWMTAGPNASRFDQIKNGAIGAVVGAGVGAVSGALLQPHMSSAVAVQAVTGFLGATVANPATTAINQARAGKPIKPFENFTVMKLAPGWIGSVAGPAAVGAARVATGLANSTLASLGSIAGGTTAAKLLPLGAEGFENATSILGGMVSGLTEGTLVSRSGKQNLPTMAAPDPTSGGLFSNPNSLCIVCTSNYSTGGFTNQGGKYKF
ncbi:MAG: RHS repeat-associated core domain-containing protein, partial [Candidatus Thermoplasmatota archaeon]|nr:RHS repeat-associated core domain-containing protein [Candidatus Thermoplasmatota archaeon]